MPATESRLPDPPLLSGFPRSLLIRLLGGRDLRASEAQVRAFRGFAQTGDPLADRLVEEMRALPPGRRRGLFERALVEGVDAVEDPPEALRCFFEQVDAEPPWLDRARLELAARTFARTGLVGLYGPLGDVALIGGYLASRPDKVLVRTGDLAAQAPRRLTETASWWVEVTSPGALRRDAAGFRAVLRVRLTHAHIRAAMRRRDDWDQESWDDPVNQVHLAGTLMLFSLIFTVGMQLLGFRFSREERAAIFHLWRYVGHLLGVHPELLPADEADSWRIAWLEAATEFVPDEDSRRLAEALTAALPAAQGLGGDDPISRVAAWGLRHLHGSYSRIVLGDANADLLGIPDLPPFKAAVLALAAANFALETARGAIPGATRLSVLVGDRTRRAAIRAGARRMGADLSYTRELRAAS